MIKWLKSKWEKCRQYRWYFGIGWVKRSNNGILPSKNKTPEEIKTFEAMVDRVTKGGNNRIGYNNAGGFPWNTIVDKK